jgi:hypothetical protein
MSTKSTSSQAENGAERVLTLMGYDRDLVFSMSEKHRGALRGAAVSWLVACLVLGAAAAYAAWLIMPGVAAPIVGGLSITILTVNLLRVIHSGGGSKLGRTAGESEAACRDYRPSLIPALVFAVFAVILAQPAQIPFWSEIEPQVEQHRQTLIEQHSIAAAELGTDADYYRAELESAGFPIFRLKLIWQDPKRAVRLTFIVLMLVLLPAIWSQFFAIESVRAYERERSKRTHRIVARLDQEVRDQVNSVLGGWQTYRPLESGPMFGRPAV